MVCGLALEAKDLTVADLREGADVMGVTALLVESADASRTFCFQALRKRRRAGFPCRLLAQQIAR
jgi:hypothetical protein